MASERLWHTLVSYVAGGVACGVGLWCAWFTLPGLWELATFTPTRPIRPMGLVAGLGFGIFGGGLIGLPLSTLALWMSERSTAQAVASVGILASSLPFLNFLAFWLIILIRGIELAS